MKANNVSFKYYEGSKNTVIDRLSLEIEPEKISLIIGNSGSGKSTLAGILAGLYPANGGILIDGTVTIENTDISLLSPEKRVHYVSMMFQNADLQFCMPTLYEELIFCLENISLTNEEIDLRISDACKIVNTDNLKHRKMNTLSGGEKQKCALTCIVALRSKYMILDEPFANIDPNTALDFVEVLYKINQQQKTTIIIIDHIIDRWLPYADIIYLLKNSQTIIKTDINIDNLHTFRSLFDDNGLVFPIEIPVRKQRSDISEPIITISNLFLSIENKTLLENTSLSISRGSVTALTGSSGCGKTSFLKCLYGKTKFTGEIKIDDLTVNKKNFKKLCKILGIVLQNPANQFVSQNVLEEVMFGLDNKSNSEENHTKALKLLADFGLDIYQKYSPYMLSQGQQRRLAVLSVLSSSQKILLLDEPTYGQDAVSTKAIMSLLQHKVKNENLTVIFTTHDKKLAYEYADNIINIENMQFNSIAEVTF